MGINWRNPGVIVIGGFLAVGAVNSLTNTFTGQYLFGGDDEVQTTSSQNSAPAEVNAKGWARPVGGTLDSNYGVPGNLWASGHHTGVDFPVGVGTPAHAASSGTVVTAGNGGKYGNQIVIRHQERLYSQYAHLSRIDVSEGDKVKAGEQIGLTGASGNVTGPHLHFEVRTGQSYGSDINPVPFIPKNS